MIYASWCKGGEDRQSIDSRLKRNRDAFFCYAVSHVTEAFPIAVGKAPFLEVRSMQAQPFRDTDVQAAHAHAFYTHAAWRWTKRLGGSSVCFREGRSVIRRIK
jgi:hypothetical protein